MTQTQPVIQERVRFADSGRLAGVLHYPGESAPRYAVLLCSPHPNFAGDMDNNVIRALADGLAAEAVVLRFDYRGIGNSRIDLPPGLSVFDYWEEIEQAREYGDALADTAAAADELHRLSGGLPMVAVGYSFGSVTATLTALRDDRFVAMAGIAPPLQRVAFEFLADCPRPCLMVSGEDDFVHDPDAAARLIGSAGPQLVFERLKAMDHFFRDREDVLTQRISRFVARNVAAIGAREETL
ncbi:MAG: alpha/beta hydrolase [Tepidisphaerales bacterium]